MQAIPESLGAAVAPETTDDYPTSPVDITASSQTLAIRVDMRERQSPVPGLLAAFPDVTLSFGALPSADYVLSEEVAVERKTASDFVASILDRRLFGQVTRMKILFPRALLIIEGNLTQVPHSIDMEAIRGALAFLVVREGITVLQVGDAVESAAMLHIMARHAQERMASRSACASPGRQLRSCTRLISLRGCQGSAHAVPACCWRTLAHLQLLCVHLLRSWHRCQELAGRAPSASGKR